MDTRDRLAHLTRFYALLDRVEQQIGGTHTLAACDGYMAWPQQGIYFFKEYGETRSDSGTGLRVVRVGTHAVRAGSNTPLWRRLAQHKGTQGGGGYHRGSVFRRLVGTALTHRQGYAYPTWGVGTATSSAVAVVEAPLEREVSQVIGSMPFLWLAADDEPGPDSVRGYLERNTVALLSNYQTAPLDPPSKHWLGRDCDREKVRESGLWNQDYVDLAYDPDFLEVLEAYVADQTAIRCSLSCTMMKLLSIL